MPRAIYATCLRCVLDAACARCHIHATHFRSIPEYLPYLRDSLAVVPTRYAGARLAAA
jgi:hypothetical protein